MDKRTREAIEAWQPGDGDLLGPQPLGSEPARSPELAGLAQQINADPTARRVAERVQAWDAAIGHAMEQVPVPAGLAERLLARLQASEAAPSAGAGMTENAGIPLEDALPAGGGSLLSGVAAALGQQAAGSAAGESEEFVSLAGSAPAPLSNQRWWQRRYWAGASISTIAVCGAVILLGYWLQMSADLPLDQLAQQWETELTEEWEPVDGAPRGYSVPDSIRVPPTRFQRIHWLTPARVVAYELVQGRNTAVLYVARMHREGLRAAPPAVPQMDTAGKAIGYWHSGDIVYVLVVPDRRSYQAFVRPSAAPLAIARPISRLTRKIA